MKRFFYSLLTLGLLFPGTMVLAKGKPKPTPPPKHTVIKVISGSSVTIDTGALIKDYKLDEHTVFTYQGKRVAQSELKPGMRAAVTPGFDGQTATLVAASEAPRPVASPAAAPKKK